MLDIESHYSWTPKPAEMNGVFKGDSYKTFDIFEYITKNHLNISLPNRVNKDTILNEEKLSLLKDFNIYEYWMDVMVETML